MLASVCLALLFLSLQVFGAGNPALLQTTDSNDGFGSSVSVAGVFVLVGAPAGNSGTGAAHVYSCAADASACSKIIDILPFDATPGQAFGASVSIFVADNTHAWIAVGAPGATHGSNGTVHMYFFNPTSGQYSSYANITGSNNGNLGAAVVATFDPLSKTAFLYASEPFAKNTYVFNCTTPQQCAFGIPTTQTLTNSTLQVTDGFGSALTAFGFVVFIGAPGRNSNLGSVFIFIPNDMGVFTQMEEIAIPSQVPLGFGYAMAMDINILAMSASIYLGSKAGLVIPVSCSLKTATCTNANPIQGNYLDGYGASLAAANGYYFIGANNATHATANDGEIYTFGAGGAVGKVLTYPGTKYLGKVLAAAPGSNLLVAGADTDLTVAKPYVYVFAIDQTATPAPTTAPTTAMKTTTSGASSTVASFFLIALLLACQLLF